MLSPKGLINKFSSKYLSVSTKCCCNSLDLLEKLCFYCWFIHFYTRLFTLTLTVLNPMIVGFWFKEEKHAPALICSASFFSVFFLFFFFLFSSSTVFFSSTTNCAVRALQFFKSVSFVFFFFFCCSLSS